MKRAAIVSCNDSYDFQTRTKYVRDYLVKRDYEVTFVVADFDHRNKTKYLADRDDRIVYIHVSEYKKNISLRRIVSHLLFSSRVKKFLKNNFFDLVYHCAPPNSTIKSISKIKDRCRFKLITEIGDMWPETFPVSSGKKIILSIPFFFWARFRNRYLYNSDYVIAECELFKQQLIKNGATNNSCVLYFCKQENFVSYSYSNHRDTLDVCYLGSVNNIIDIGLIACFTREVLKHKKMILHLIGCGENKDSLVSAVTDSGGIVKDYGPIFDDSRKKAIFSNCLFSLNIMKECVNVGMTMKSLDYFSFGIPMINSVGGDIHSLVASRKIGFNICKGNIEDVVNKICEMSSEEHAKLVDSVRLAHKELFSVETFNRNMDKIMDK